MLVLKDVIENVGHSAVVGVYNYAQAVEKTVRHNVLMPVAHAQAVQVLVNLIVLEVVMLVVILDVQQEQAAVQVINQAKAVLVQIQVQALKESIAMGVPQHVVLIVLVVVAEDVLAVVIHVALDVIQLVVVDVVMAVITLVLQPVMPLAGLEQK